jgi:hypothetical protein
MTLHLTPVAQLGLPCLSSACDLKPGLEGIEGQPLPSNVEGVTGALESPAVPGPVELLAAGLVPAVAARDAASSQ